MRVEVVQLRQRCGYCIYGLESMNVIRSYGMFMLMACLLKLRVLADNHNGSLRRGMSIGSFWITYVSYLSS